MTRPQVGDFQVDIGVTERKCFVQETVKKNDELNWLFKSIKSMINAFVLFDSVFDEKGTFISYRFVFINDSYEQITGVKNEGVRGKTVHEVWPETESSWIQKYGKVAVTGIPQSFEMYHDPTKNFYNCNVYRPWETNDRFCVIFEDITERKTNEEEREKLLVELQKSLEEIKTLKGIIPICMHCKGIRDDKGSWTQLEKFITEHSEAEFSHGICDECLKKYYPEEYEDE